MTQCEEQVITGAFEGLAVCVAGLLLMFCCVFFVVDLLFGLLFSVIGCALTGLGLFDLCNSLGLVNFYKRLKRRKTV